MTGQSCPHPPSNNGALLPQDPPTDSSIPPALFYVEVNYGENLCDVYQVPLAFTTGPVAEQITAERPLSIVAPMATPAGQGILHDATVREDFRQLVLLSLNVMVR